MEGRKQPYLDRVSGGNELAGYLSAYRGRPNAVVVGLCRGGVPVGAAVAEQLNLPLEVGIVRKLGLPENPELAMGAIVEGGVEVHNPEVLRWVSEPEVALGVARLKEEREIARRVKLYREGRALNLRGKCVLLVDDGAATGATIRAAIRMARRAEADWVLVGLPVASLEACAQLSLEADELVCPWRRDDFRSVGECYTLFPQITDEEVCALLKRYGGAAHLAESGS